MPDQIDAEILQILGRQARQYRCVDLVRAKHRLVLLEPEFPQPIRDIHPRHDIAWLANREPPDWHGHCCLTRISPAEEPRDDPR